MPGYTRWLRPPWWIFWLWSSYCMDFRCPFHVNEFFLSSFSRRGGWCCRINPGLCRVIPAYQHWAWLEWPLLLPFFLHVPFSSYNHNHSLIIDCSTNYNLVCWTLLIYLQNYLYFMVTHSWVANNYIIHNVQSTIDVKGKKRLRCTN